MEWLARLRQAGAQAPLRPRVPLLCGGVVTGSVEPEFMSRVASACASDNSALLQKTEQGWTLCGEPTASLAELSALMQRLELHGAVRNEQLAVHGANGQLIGTVERGAVRPLGITTHAVHLAGQTPDGRHWVQQRSFDKDNDPGQWDTLMGGMVSASDTLEAALERETWEEAGLALALLRHLKPGGRVTIRRPSADGAGMGYMVEHIDWFRATVPFGIAPVNLDGEVEQFELLTREEVLQRLEAGEFTLEAALILSEVLGLG